MGDGSWNDSTREQSPTLKRKKMNIIVPGLGIIYQWKPSTQFIAGVHKGFSPPGPGADEDEDVQPEESINFEWGTRIRSGFTDLNLIAFHNRYDNLLGDDTQFSGGGTYDQFNAGKVDIDGLELSLSHTVSFKEFWIPFTCNYTYTRTEFLSSFESEFDGWGDITVGDELPYVPVHQFFLESGLSMRDWKFYFRYRQTSPMRTIAGSGDLLESEKTDFLAIVDVTSEYQITSNINVYMKILNVLDQQGIVAARPAGVRPTMPRSISAGIRLSF